MRKLLLMFMLVALALPALAQIPSGCSQVSSDNFTRADAGTLGANWTVLQGTWGISSNKGVVTAAPGQSNLVYRSAETYTDDQCASIKIAFWSGTSRLGPVVRIPNSSTKSGYYAYCSSASSGNCNTVILAKVVADSVSTLQTISSLTLPGSVEFGISATGSATVTLKVWSNGAQIGSTTTDSTGNRVVSGHPGLTTYNTFTSTFGLTYWEGGTFPLGPANTPTISPAGGTYIPQQSVTLACTSPSPSIYYTTDGSTPTIGSTLYAGAFNTVSSGSETIKAICTSSGYTTSAVASSSYVIAPADVAIVSDDFSTYYDSNLEGSLVQQFPLDTIYTAGKWKAMPALTGDAGIAYRSNIGLTPLPTSNCTPHASGHCIGTAGDAATITPVVYTGRTGFNSDQFASGYANASSGINGAAVFVRCSTSGFTCYSFYGVSTGVYLYKYVAGGRTTLASSGGIGVVSNDNLELRVVGSQLQALLNGSVVLSATDSAIASGVPGVGTDHSGGISNISMGNIGVADATSPVTYTPTNPNYSDAMNGAGWTPGWPWFKGQMKGVSVFTGIWTASLTAVANPLGGFAAGMAGTGNAVYPYRSEFGSNQYQKVTLTVDTPAVALNNIFFPLQMQTYIPGYADGGCDAAGTSATCYDAVAYYPGIEPLNNAISLNGVTATCGGALKAEYTCTPFMHITKVTPIASPGNQVITVAGSYYTPRIGDQLFMEYDAPHLRVACKGNATNIVAWQASHAYTAGTFIVDSNGLWQRVKTPGTSGGSHPTWYAGWDSVHSAGDTTTDNTVVWESYGEPCPTTDRWSWVIDSNDTDLASAKGVPGMWLGATGGTAWGTGWSGGTIKPGNDAFALIGLSDPASRTTSWVNW